MAAQDECNYLYMVVRDVLDSILDMTLFNSLFGRIFSLCI